MNERASHIVVIVSVFLVALLLSLGGIFYVAGQWSNHAGARSAIGGPFKLIDHHRQPITDRDMRGKPFLVFFGYTHCPDACPTTLFELSEVMRAMGKDADHTRVLFITIDPERDTAESLKDYLSSFDSHLIGATGDRQAIDAVEKAYRVYAKKVPGKDNEYSMDHTTEVYLMDKQGRFVAPFKLDRSPEEAVRELRRYL